MQFLNKTTDQILDILQARSISAKTQNLEEGHALEFVVKPLLNDVLELRANEQRALNDAQEAIKLVERYKAAYGDEPGEPEKAMEGPMEEPAFPELESDAFLEGPEGISITTLNAKNVYVSVNHTHIKGDEDIEAGEVSEPTAPELIAELEKRRKEDTDNGHMSFYSWLDFVADR